MLRRDFHTLTIIAGFDQIVLIPACLSSGVVNMESHSIRI